MTSTNPFFQARGYTVTSERRVLGESYVDAVLEIQVGDRLVRHAATGVGPVHALDNALRRCLGRDFPEVASVRLSDYRVSVMDADKATGAHVRVLIRATNGEESWDAGCVSDNIIDASFDALCTTFVLGIMRARSAIAASA